MHVHAVMYQAPISCMAGHLCTIDVVLSVRRPCASLTIDVCLVWRPCAPLLLIAVFLSLFELDYK